MDARSSSGARSEGRVDVALIGAEIEENLALRYLVSACRDAGLRAEVVPFAAEDEIPRVVAQALALAPRAIGLSPDRSAAGARDRSGDPC